MADSVIYAVYEDPEQLKDGARKLVSNGVKVKDVFSPFPVHGIDPIIGVTRTRLAIASFMFGLTGLALAILGITYFMIWDWPMNIGGKPNMTLYQNIPAFVPVMFELTVLLCAFACGFGMWGLNGMPRLSRPLLAHDRFRRASQDRFYIVIESRDPIFELEKTRAFLASLGGSVVDEVRESVED